MDNHGLVLHALNNPPSLIIDCANAANPHKFYGMVPQENFRKTYVVAVDAIYRFRDTLKEAPVMARSLGAKTIVITSYKHLYAFGDDDEVKDVIAHCKEIIIEISKEFRVLTAPGVSL